MTNWHRNSSFIGWRAVAIAALLVVSSQATLAGHQFEHDLGTATEVCSTCAGIQNQAAPPPDNTATTPDSVSTFAITPAMAGLFTVVVRSIYPARAPPHTS